MKKDKEKRERLIPGKDIHPPSSKKIFKDLIHKRFGDDPDIDEEFFDHQLLWQMMSPRFLDGVVFWLEQDINNEDASKDYIFPSFLEFKSYLIRAGCVRKIENN